MEEMQARLTALEPNDRLLTTPALLVVNCVKQIFISPNFTRTLHGHLEIQNFFFFSLLKERFHISKRPCQRAKKVVSDSPGLVDFATGLVNCVLNLLDGQVKFLGGIHCNQSCSSKKCFQAT